MPEMIAEKTFDADEKVLYDVLEYITSAFSGAGCRPKSLRQLEVSAEEVFINIASYAYAPEERGKLRVRLFVEDGGVAVTEFSDWGTPFDPLAKPDADITLTAEQREIGGLGILMTKKIMDSVSYKREDGMNILTLKKSFT